MALNFPNSPTLGQVYTSGLFSWAWDGTVWASNTSTVSGATGFTGATGPMYPRTTTAITGATGLIPSNDVALVDCTLGPVTLSLPPVATSTNAVLTIKKIDGTTNNLTVKGNGSELIDGSNKQIISYQWSSITVICNGSKWFMV